MDQTNADSPKNQDIKKKSRIAPAVIVVALFLLVIIGAGIIIITVFALPKSKAKKQVDLGEKYLTDMDYENAVLAFREAIRIDPKNEEAYLGLAEAYLNSASGLIANGDAEGAARELKRGIKELEQGRDIADSKEIEDKIKEMDDKKAEIESDDTDKKKDTENPNDDKKNEDKKNEEKSEKVKEEVQVNYEEIYRPVLQEHYNFIKKYSGTELAQPEENYQYISYGIYELTIYGGYATLDNIGYVIMDINGDGISELLICEENSGTEVWGGYTCKDSKPVQFLAGAERDWFYWVGNGGFLEHSCGSAWDGTCQHHYLKKNDTKLSCDEFYFTTTFDYVDTVYYRNNNTFTENPAESERISAQELTQFENQYTYETLPLKSLKSWGN